MKHLTKRQYIASTLILLVIISVIALITFIFLSSDDSKSDNKNVTPESFMVSYPVSNSQNSEVPVMVDPSGNVKNGKSPDYSEIPADVPTYIGGRTIDKNAPFDSYYTDFAEDDTTKSEMDVIYRFYKALDEKDFDEAYELGSQGRDKQTIANLYVDAKGIGYKVLSKSADHSYKLQVQIVDGNYIYKFYDTTLKLSNGKIIASESTPINENLTLECKDKIYWLFDCVVRGSETGRLFYIPGGGGLGIGLDYHFKFMEYDDAIYFGSNISEGFSDDMNVYRFDKSLGEVKFIDKFKSVHVDHLLDSEKFPDDCYTFSTAACYQEGRELYKYRNEGWYKLNLDFIKYKGVYY